MMTPSYSGVSSNSLLVSFSNIHTVSTTLDVARMLYAVHTHANNIRSGGAKRNSGGGGLKGCEGETLIRVLLEEGNPSDFFGLISRIPGLHYGFFCFSFFLVFS